MFKLSISSTILRFYLMMVVGVIAVYSGQSWLVLVTFAIAVSAILGYRIGPAKVAEKGKIVPLETTHGYQKRKAG